MRSARSLRTRGASQSSSKAASISSSVSQRITSCPHEPNRGLKTSGATSSGSASHGATWTVRGCGTPAANSALAVASLSCAATSVRCPLSTVTPSASSRSSAERPGSIPSSVGRMSRRPSATSPGRNLTSACAGVSTAPRRVLVGVIRWAMTAKVVMCRASSCQLRLKGEGQAARPCAGPLLLRNPCGRERGLASASIPSSALRVWALEAGCLGAGGVQARESRGLPGLERHSSDASLGFGHTRDGRWL